MSGPAGSSQWAYATSSTYDIPYSCRFNGSSSHMYRLPSETTNTTTWAWSCWVKRCKFEDYHMLFGGINTSGAAARSIFIGFDNTDRLVINDWHDMQLSNERKFRDPSAWYHIFMQYDSTQTTDSNRIKIWVNGEVHALTENTGAGGSGWDGYPPEDHQTMVNMASEYSRIGNNNATRWFDGYMAEMHFFDGASIFSDDSGSANSGFNVNSFGETGDYGEWKPKEYDGDASHGTNGFYLDFSDSAALGDDASGSVDWTVSNLDAADQMLDTPTNNFATLNAVWKDSSVNLQEGNLRHNRTSNMNRPALSTLGMGTGKWYFEAWDSYTTGNQIGVEWEGADVETYVHNSGTQAYTWSVSGATYANGSYDGGGNAGAVNTGNNIRMVAYDGATGKLWGGANGTWGSSGDPAAGTNESMTVPVAYRDKMHGIVATENSSTSQGIIANFGQDSSFAGNLTAQGNQDDNEIGDFYYDVPAGFLALCTSNLDTPAVTPSEHFNTLLYTGDASADRAITGVGFAPDLVWVKERNNTAHHVLLDSVRGSAGGRLSSNRTNGEDNGSGVAIGSFDSDGFTTGSSYSFINGSTPLVAWNWKANGSGSSNTDGSINTTATSANTDAGFSISTYSGNGSAGATVGHGLSKVPEMVMIKRRDALDNWPVHHAHSHATPEDYHLYLDATSAALDNDVQFHDTLPSATVVTIGDNDQVNNSSGTYVMYCWHSVDGYSKVGSYNGNDDADGAFVYTGFRPAFVIIKPSSRGGHWMMANSESNPYNVVDKVIFANDSAGEYTDPSADCKKDFLSNGFKLRTADDNTNDDETYIYLAFAETPFKYANAR